MADMHGVHAALDRSFLQWKGCTRDLLRNRLWVSMHACMHEDWLLRNSHGEQVQRQQSLQEQLLEVQGELHEAEGEVGRLSDQVSTLQAQMKALTSQAEAAVALADDLQRQLDQQLQQAAEVYQLSTASKYGQLHLLLNTLILPVAHGRQPTFRVTSKRLLVAV